MEIVNTIIQFYLPFILGGLVIAVIVLFVLCIILFLKIGRERKRYDIFMGTSRRPDHNLEMKINTYFETVKAIEKKYDKLLDMVTDIDATASENIQKIGLIRYNPFDEMGGNLCFALALLDAKDNGIVLNGIHSRTGSFTYAKPIEMGVSTYVLSTEEIQAVKLAQETAHKQKAEKVVKVKPKKLFKRKDKPLFEQENKKEEKIGMIGDVTTDESASIMAEEEDAKIAFATTVPGDIIPVNMTEVPKGIILQKGAFLCAENNIELKIKFTKRFTAGLFGGEGFILQEAKGQGMLFLEIDGDPIIRELAPGEVLKVDTGNIVAFEPSISYEIETVKGLGNIFLGGEGLFLTRLVGPGKVILQSQNFGDFAGRIAAMIPTGR